jgi:hypothetical protein
MSRKSYVTLTLSVQVPIPQGKTQKATIEWVTSKLNAADAFFSTLSHGIVIKLLGRHTTYL